MDNIGIRKIELIVTDLLSEFQREGGKLQAEYDDNAARILEIEENIHKYKENEDVDFQVFSPRKIDNHNAEKIDSMNKEKESIENINKSLYRQIRYYTEKIDKLQEILDIISEDNPEEAEEVKTEDISKVDEKILEYYDSIIGDDKKEEPDEELESDSTPLRTGWKLIKDETPIDPVSLKEERDEESVKEELLEITEKLNKESKVLEEDYLRTREEINSILKSVSALLESMKK